MRDNRLERFGLIHHKEHKGGFGEKAPSAVASASPASRGSGEDGDPPGEGEQPLVAPLEPYRSSPRGGGPWQLGGSTSFAVAVNGPNPSRHSRYGCENGMISHACAFNPPRHAARKECGL